MRELARVLRVLRAKINKRSKYFYVLRCSPGARVLDVGCGNYSADKFMEVNPLIYYYGLDVADYNISSQTKALMARYLVVDPKKFASTIGEFYCFFDLVVSAHNLEHCESQDAVIDSICNSVQDGGIVFFSFPCDASVGFPERNGTLNFYDDPTHLKIPNFVSLYEKLKCNGFEILLAKKRARFWPEVLIGLIVEPISFILKRVYPGTWALWGFESVVVAKKSPHETG